MIFSDYKVLKKRTFYDISFRPLVSSLNKLFSKIEITFSRPFKVCYNKLVYKSGTEFYGAKKLLFKVKVKAKLIYFQYFYVTDGVSINLPHNLKSVYVKF